MKTRHILFACVLSALIFAPAAVPQAASTRVYAVSPGSFLGVNVSEIDSERARALNLKEEYGVEITRVEEGSPAEKAGLKKGDVVLEYNGQRVEGTEQFVRMVRETPSGRQVKLVISRNGAGQTLTVTTATRRGMALGPRTITIPPIQIPDIQIPDVPRANMTWRSSMLGVEAESVEGQLAEYFGVKEGVLVRSVMKGSAAEKAGMKAGDIILKVGDTRVATPREVSSAIRTQRGKGAFSVIVMRQHHEMTLNVSIEEERSNRERRTFHFGELRL